MPPNKEINKERIYDEIDPFHEGIALAKKDGRFFHILPNGHEAYPQRYVCASRFRGGRACVCYGAGCYTINRTGERIDLLVNCTGKRK